MTDITKAIYQNEDAAREHLEGIRWSEGVYCPLCGGTEKIAPVKMMNKAIEAKPATAKRPAIEAKPAVEVKGYYHCGDCRRKFTVRTGTVYERSHVPLHKWVLATQLLCSSKKGMSAHQLHRMLGVTYKTAWFMFHRIRESMIDGNPGPMGGPGETYIGKKAVKSATRTSGKPFIKSGGAAHKCAVVGLVSQGKSRMFHVARADAETVREILVTNVSRDTDLHTDESRLYVKVGKEFANHQSESTAPENMFVTVSIPTTSRITSLSLSAA